MINRYTRALPFALALTAAVGMLGTLTAAAQTSGTGYDMLNAQSANPSASTNSTVYGSTSTTANSTYPSGASSTTGTTNTTDTTGTVNTTNAVQTAAPGVPNTGSGGDAPVNLAVLIISGLIVAAGMTYVTLKLAL